MCYTEIKQANTCSQEDKKLILLIDKIILFVYSLGSCLFIVPDAAYIICFLAFFAASFFLYGLSPKRFQMLSLTVWGLLVFFLPKGACFFPVLFYDMLSGDLKSFEKIPAIMCAALFLYRILQMPQPLLYYEIFGICLAAFLCYRTTAFFNLSEKYRQTRDDAAERNLLLKEKNKTLLEKQNYEIYAATLKERNRIAREIHDHVGHMLSRSILMVGAMKTISRDPALKTPFEQLEETLNTAMNNIRESVHDLHDESINLKESAENLVQDFHFCPVTMEYDMGISIPSAVKYCFLSILKEALSNIARHSNASHARIVMREHPGLYQLIIQDNGTAFSAVSSGGMGLSNMRDRVEALKGTIDFQEEKGFRIFIMIPRELPDAARHQRRENT